MQMIQQLSNIHNFPFLFFLNRYVPKTNVTTVGHNNYVLSRNDDFDDLGFLMT